MVVSSQPRSVPWLPDTQRVLPMGIKFPTKRGVRRELLLERSIAEAREEERERFQREVAEPQRRRRSEELNAAEGEVRQRQEQERRRQEQERQRQEQERQRQEKERQRQEALRLEQERLEAIQQDRQRREKEADEATAEMLKRSGALNGDLRMCKRCRAGPIENKACPSLSSHAHDSGTYKGNRCPNCNWFDAVVLSWLAVQWRSEGRLRVG